VLTPYKVLGRVRGGARVARVRWRAVLGRTLLVLLPALALGLWLSSARGWRPAPPILVAAPANAVAMASVEERAAFCQHARLVVPGLQGATACNQIAAPLARLLGGTVAAPPPALPRLVEACLSGQAVVSGGALVFRSAALGSICLGRDGAPPRECASACAVYPHGP
jgi:hypothetical protein